MLYFRQNYGSNFLQYVLRHFNKSKGLCFSSTFYSLFFAKIPTVGVGTDLLVSVLFPSKVYGRVQFKSIQTWNLATNNGLSFSLIHGQEAENSSVPLTFMTYLGLASGIGISTNKFFTTHCTIIVSKS